MKRVILKAFAHISKIHSHKGEVVAQFLPGFSFSLPEGSEVYCLPPELDERLTPRRLHIARAHVMSETTLRLSFREISRTDLAERYVGKTLAVDERLLRELAPAASPALLIGKQVVDDVFGLLGHIHEVLSSAAQDTWVVRGEQGDVMIPAVDAFIHPFSLDDATIRCSIPKSLLEMAEPLD